LAESQNSSISEQLAASDARFHGWAADVEVNWGLNPDALRFLEEHVRPGSRTLETGAGFSTVVMAARGAIHTVVSPFAFEHDRLRRWCQEQEIDLSSVTFEVAASQDALPALDSPLDLVLIDGDHAFPIPYVDFWYAGGRLVQGGLLVVDDTDLRACRVLTDFLESDTQRWRLHTKFRTTTVFERLAGPMLPAAGWEAQPWGARPLLAGGRWSLLTRLRARLRVRTRLKRLLGRPQGRAVDDDA
jgi:hypothetical protein